MGMPLVWPMVRKDESCMVPSLFMKPIVLKLPSVTDCDQAATDIRQRNKNTIIFFISHKISRNNVIFA